MRAPHSFEGSVLRLVLKPNSRWKPERVSETSVSDAMVSLVTARLADGVFFGLSASDEGKPGKGLGEVRRIETATERIDDQTLAIDLSRGELAPFTPEQQRQYAVVETTQMVAGLIAHELGHQLKLERRMLVQNYPAAKNGFELVSGMAQAARAKAKVRTDNDLWHDSTGGGDGEHCHTGCGAAKVRVGARDLWQRAEGQRTCAMYWTVQTWVRDDLFCDRCIELLRRSIDVHYDI